MENKTQTVGKTTTESIGVTKIDAQEVINSSNEELTGYELADVLLSRIAKSDFSSQF